MHIGIIMDGNGRWATSRGLPRLSGHQAGVEAVKTLVRACPEIGVNSMTLFAFAIANWKRDKEEVDGLWKIFDVLLAEHLKELIDDGVRIVVIGNRSGLLENTRKEVIAVEERSKQNTKFLLQIALNYDGVDEVARMVQRTIEDGITAKEITVEYIQEHLDTGAHKAPDIIIRTGMPSAQNGMSVWRSSAFLPIQSVQSVCISSQILWPDFTPKDLQEIISYADLDSRLFGGQRNSV